MKIFATGADSPSSNIMGPATPAPCYIPAIQYMLLNSSFPRSTMRRKQEIARNDIIIPCHLPSSLERSTGITKKLPRPAQRLCKRPAKNTVERLTCACVCVRCVCA